MKNKYFNCIGMFLFFINTLIYGAEKVEVLLIMQIFDTQPEYLHLVRDTIHLDSNKAKKLIQDLKLSGVAHCDSYLCGHTGIYLKILVTSEFFYKTNTDTIIVDYGFGCLKTKEATIWNYKNENNCVMTKFTYSEKTEEFLKNVWERKKENILNIYDYKRFELVKKKK